VEYHTFQPREDKPLKAVIQNLHSSTPTELIESELEIRLYKVRQVTNVLHKINKRPLPLFFIDLEPTDHSNEINHLSSLLHTKVKIEEPYKPKMVSQCLNSQDYGHTRSYFGYSARCVRRGDSHSSSDCTKSRDYPPKCTLCSDNHPANYLRLGIYLVDQEITLNVKLKTHEDIDNAVDKFTSIIQSAAWASIFKHSHDS